MSLVFRWSFPTLVGLSCLACYGATIDDDDETTGGSAGSAGSEARGGTASGSGGTAGSVSQGGAVSRGGAPPGGSPTGGSPSGGSAGTAQCNDLELIGLTAICSPPGELPALTGGQITDGLYLLLGYTAASCDYVLEETLRITRTSDSTYDVEVVAAVEAAGLTVNANAVFVTSGTTLTSSLTCGGEGEPQQSSYSMVQTVDSAHLVVSDEDGVYTYQRFGD